MTNFEKLILGSKTSLEDIEAAGYSIESNGYSTYFRYKGGKVEQIPFWVLQFKNICVKTAIENHQESLRDLLGIK